MEALAKEEQQACTYCFDPLTDEESESPRTDPYEDVMCDECYQIEYQDECGLCENYFNDPQIAKHHKFVVGRELAKETGLKMGVYSVLEYPFHYGSIVTGFDGFFDHAIKLEREMDVREYKRIDCSFRDVRPVGGTICLECFNELTQPLNKVNQDQKINMSAKRKLHRTINLRGAMQPKSNAN